MNDLLLGIDIGTSGCKITAIDGQGRIVDTAFGEYRIGAPARRLVGAESRRLVRGRPPAAPRDARPPGVTGEPYRGPDPGRLDAQRGAGRRAISPLAPGDHVD